MYFGVIQQVFSKEGDGVRVSLIMENVGVLKYLSMQKGQMNKKSEFADVQKDRIYSDAVVGSWEAQEAFNYDHHVLKCFSKNTLDSIALEYGCGPGRNIRRLAPGFKRIDGVDVSGVSLGNAERFLKLNNVFNYRLYENNGCDIPVESGSYDLVFAVICITHIASYTVRKHIFKEMYRVLNSDGIVVIQFGFGINNGYCKKHGVKVVNYYADAFDAQDTNGACDFYVELVDQPVNDLINVGFNEVTVWFSAPATGIAKHAKWLWCCGKKGQSCVR